MDAASPVVNVNGKNMPGPSSDVWKYFTLSEDKKKTRCEICSKSLAYNGGTSAMRNHIKFVHKATAASAGVSVKKQPTLLGFSNMFAKKKLSKSQYEENNRSLALMCALDLRPISMVEGRGFRAFCKKLNPEYKIPCRKTITKHVMILYEENKKDLIELMKDTPGVSFTTDLWTSTATRGFITVTGHFITNDWDLHSHILATRALDERHTGENIAETIVNIGREFSVPKILALVTDNAGNMIKAADDAEIPRWPCFSHTLQLCVQDGIKVGPIKDALAFGRKLVGHFSHSSMATEALKEQQRKMGTKHPVTVIQDVCTRWNSQYFMAKRLIELRVPIYAVLLDDTVTNANARSQLDLKDSTWKILEDIEAPLEPLVEATELLTKEEEPTISQVYVVLQWLIGVLQVARDDSGAIKKMKMEILSKLKKRFGLDDEGKPKGDTITSLPMISMALDPRHKSLRFLTEGQRDIVSNRIEELLTSLKSEERASSDNIVVKTTVKTEDLEPKRPKLQLHQMMQGDVVCIDLTKQQSTTEYAMFLQDPVTIPDPLKWWKVNATRFPHLSVLAKLYLAIPATEVPSERAFSTAGATITKLRASLDPGTVDAIIFLHKNFKFQVCLCSPSCIYQWWGFI